MKKILLLLILLAAIILVTLEVSAQTGNRNAKKDTNYKVKIEKQKAGRINKQKPPRTVKSRRARMQMQLRQARIHEQQDQKVKQVQKKVKKATRDTTSH